MQRFLWIALAVLSGLNAIALAAEADDANTAQAKVRQRLAVAEAIEESYAVVEITLRQDKGEQPYAGGYGYHYGGLGEYLEQERPMELPALVLAPGLVMADDPRIHPRFIESIEVRYGEQRVSAQPESYAPDADACFYRLAKPLAEAKPLAFDANAGQPALVAQVRDDGGEWAAVVNDYSPPPAVYRPSTGGRTFGQEGSLILDANGKALGLIATNELKPGEDWKGSPTKWRRIPAKQMDARLEGLKQATEAGLMRVKLHFRSPRKQAEMHMYGRGSENQTEIDTVGLLLPEGRLLVPVSLQPKVTARLERIQVFPADGEPVEASFLCTLKDYDALVATLPGAAGEPLAMDTRPIRSHRDRMLLEIEMKLQGDTLTLYSGRTEFAGFGKGWKGRIYPIVPGDESSTLIFDANGQLVGIPLGRRQKVSMEDPSYRYHGPAGNPQTTPVSHLQAVLEDPRAHSDSSNVPLSEEQENRLAWLGVVLQAMNPELARMREISHLTQDGRIGAVVSYVYDDSPAAKAGLEVDDILLRMHVPDQPKPIEISIDEYLFSRRPFPWDRLDQMPEEMYDRVPTPWAPAENQFTRALTDLGFGKGYTLEILRDGETRKIEMKVVESPPHYASAKRHESEPLGITVRDLTYDVRRYLQKTPEEPGVVISHMEPGSKASVAGMKPYEVITHINDKPVADVEAFEELVSAGGELRLAVKRMTKGRVVKVEIDAPATQPAEDEQDDASEDGAPEEDVTVEE